MATLNDNALTSVSDVKENLGIASSDHTKDNIITRMINAASQQIANYCDRVFKAADYTEDINASETDELVLNQRPVNSFTSLQYRTTGENISDFETIDATYYFVDNNAGVIKMNFAGRGRWNAWRATYNAGYTTIPSDLAEACAAIATHYVVNSSGTANVRSKQEGQRKIEYNQGTTGFKNLMQQLGVDQVIDGYANWPLRNE